LRRQRYRENYFWLCCLATVYLVCMTNPVRYGNPYRLCIFTPLPNKHPNLTKHALWNITLRKARYWTQQVASLRTTPPPPRVHGWSPGLLLCKHTYVVSVQGILPNV
jgi:hypothetical protein